MMRNHPSHKRITTTMLFLVVYVSVCLLLSSYAHQQQHQQYPNVLDTNDGLLLDTVLQHTSSGNTIMPMMRPMSPVDADPAHQTTRLVFDDDDDDEIAAANAMTTSTTASIRQQLQTKVTDMLTREMMLGQQAPQQQQSRRQLAIGDFEELNTLFDNARILIPDAYFETTFALIKLKVWIKNLYCVDLRIGDIVMQHQKVSDQKYSLNVGVEQVHVDCFGDYDFDYGIIGEPGDIDAYTLGNSMSVDVAFTSEDFNQYPPSGSQVEGCAAEFQITDLNFKGGIVSGAVNLFEKFLRDTVENELKKVACDELSSMGGDVINDGMQMIKSRIEGFAQPVSSERADPLYPEKNNLVVPEGTRLVDLQDDSNTIGGWLAKALQGADTLLGETVQDPGGPTGGSDLGVNVAIRRMLLDENRALTMTLDELPFPMKPVIFEGHDMLTKSKLTLRKIKLLGLDTFDSFESLVTLSKYTIQNKFRWEYIKVALVIDVDITASSQDDAVIVDEDPGSVQDQITVTLGVDNLDVVFSLMGAIDEDLLGALPLGSLLRSKNLLPCLASIFHSLEIAGLEVNVGSIHDPSVDGFISPGLDRVLNQMVQLLVDMYEPTLLKALPNMFQTSIRDILQKEVMGSGLFDKNTNNCPAPEDEAEPFMDWRDLFLKGDASRNLGGTGTARYGDLGYMIYDLIQEQLAGEADDGTATINEMVLRPMTKSQSGVEGMLRFPNDFVAVSRNVSSTMFSGLMDSFGLKLYDLRVNNVDTIINPLVMLNPTEEGTTLENWIKVGPTNQPRPLDATMRFMISMQGEGSPFNAFNEIDITASVDSLNVLSDLVAMIDSDSLMDFPLEDILNADCWLATLPEPFTLPYAPEPVRSLRVKNFIASLVSLKVNTNCLQCSDAVSQTLPEVLGILHDTGSVRLLGDRLGLVLQDIMHSESLQDVIDQALRDAPLACPSSARYDENFVKAGSKALGIPVVGSESVDTLLYTAVLAAEVGLVVFCESQMQQGAPEPSNPQRHLDGAEDEVTFIDWTDLGASLGLGGALGSMVDGLIEDARNYIGGSDESGKLRLNALVEDFVGDDGAFDFVDVVTVNKGGFIFTLNSAKIKGLNTFSKVDVIDPVEPQLLRNSIRLDSLAVAVDLSVGFDSTDDPLQNVTLSFAISDISIDVDLFAGFDLDKLGSIGLGSMLQMDNILPCILSAAHDVHLPHFSVSVGSFTNPQVAGLFADTQSSLEKSINATFDRFGADIKDSIPLIFDGTVRGLLNGILESYMTGSNCPDPLQHASGYVDFRDLFLSEKDAALLGGSGDSPYGDVLRTVKNFVYDQFLQIDPATGLSAGNDALIRKLTDGRSSVAGRLDFPGSLFDQDGEIDVGGFQANFQLRVNDAYIENLDTVGAPLDILEPIQDEPNLLNNSASIGIGRPLRAGARLLILLAGDQSVIKNDLDISLDMHTLTLVLTALVKILESRFLGFPLRDIRNMHCWLSMIPAPPLDERGLRLASAEPSLSVADLALTAAQVGLNVSCNNCSSPDMATFAELLSTEEATTGATEVANDIFAYATDLLGGEFLQVTLDRLLVSAAKQCPHNADFDASFTQAKYESLESPESDDSMTFFIAMGIVAGALLVLVYAIVLANKFIVRRRHRKWIRSLPSTKLYILSRQQDKDQCRDDYVNQSTTSMFFSPAIPWWTRWIMPVVIIGNIGFFLSGHLSLGATVNIEISLAGQQYRADNFFEFTMARNTVDIWNAGGKELAILILIFSGIWPYCKQLTALVLWFMPPKFVSTSKRLDIFLWLDALAKWSMVDIFVLVVSVAGFRVSVQSPDVPFLPDNFYSLDLLVIPMWGLYANMIAQVISQISSHFIIHYHRNMVVAATREYEHMYYVSSSPTCSSEDESLELSQGDDVEVSTESSSINELIDPLSGEEETLSRHTFARPHRGELDKLVARRMVSPMLMFIAGCLAILVVIGCIIPLFSTEVLGIVGILVESGQDFRAARNYYSVFGLVKLLFEQAAFTGNVSDYIGLGSLSMIVILTVLIVPIVQAAVLIYCWLRPMTPKRRYRLLITLEILQAWQYIEVIIIAVIVAAWQLGPVSEHMINAYCGSLKETFASLTYFGVMSEEDAQCFRVETHIENGSFILVAAAILLALLNTFVVKSMRQYFRDKDIEKQLQRGEHKLSIEESVRLGAEGMDAAAAETQIQPVPVLFTDTFRWFLCREDTMLSQHPTRWSTFSDAEATIAELPGTADVADEESQHFEPQNPGPSNEANSSDLIADTMADTESRGSGEMLLPTDACLEESDFESERPSGPAPLPADEPGIISDDDMSDGSSVSDHELD